MSGVSPPVCVSNCVALFNDDTPAGVVTVNRTTGVGGVLFKANAGLMPFCRFSRCHFCINFLQQLDVVQLFLQVLIDTNYL